MPEPVTLLSVAPKLLLALSAASVLLWALSGRSRKDRDAYRRRLGYDDETAAGALSGDGGSDRNTVSLSGWRGMLGLGTERRNLRASSSGRLKNMMRSAGLARPAWQYLGVAFLVGGALSFVITLGGSGFGFAAFLAFSATCAAGLLLLLRAQRKRLEVIEREFPSAIDIIVRGLRAGMPLLESLQLVGQEAEPAVAREFRLVVSESRLGIPVAEAVQRMASRIPIDDVRFFAVVLGLQAGAGGAVADALQAVADTLRSRRTLRQKVMILSGEARASAVIIGSLPILLTAGLFYMSPEYIDIMFSTTTGNWALFGMLVWMLIGILVMRSMINFRF